MSTYQQCVWAQDVEMARWSPPLNTRGPVERQSCQPMITTWGENALTERNTESQDSREAFFVSCCPANYPKPQWLKLTVVITTQGFLWISIAHRTWGSLHHNVGASAGMTCRCAHSLLMLVAGPMALPAAWASSHAVAGSKGRC